MTTTGNFSHICLNETDYMMHGTPLEYNLQRYVYPAIALFGILGNIVDLTVLLNKSMRSRANTFLAVLAFADIIFLVLLLPNILANYSSFTFNYYFRYLYFHTKVHLLALANWCSAVAIWCVIVVCADRLVGIRSPLYARATWPWWQLPAVITCIVVTAGALTCYQHFEYFCLIRYFCHDSQLYSQCLSVNSDTWFAKGPNPFSSGFRKFISVCVMIYLLIMIIFPIILLTALNLMLLCALRKRQKHLAVCTDQTERRNNEGQLQKTEQRVTLTVAFIVTMFTLTNGPSALIHLIRTTYQLKPRELYDITMICSTLVICGKASNFILFCLGSKHFRVRLFKITQKTVNRKIESLSGSLLTSPLSRAIVSRRQSMPSKKSSVAECTSFSKGRNHSTANIYKPLFNMSPRASCPS